MSACRERAAPFPQAEWVNGCMARFSVRCVFPCNRFPVRRVFPFGLRKGRGPFPTAINAPSGLTAIIFPFGLTAIIFPFGAFFHAIIFPFGTFSRAIVFPFGTFFHSVCGKGAALSLQQPNSNRTLRGFSYFASLRKGRGPFPTAINAPSRWHAIIFPFGAFIHAINTPSGWHAIIFPFGAFSHPSHSLFWATH